MKYISRPTIAIWLFLAFVVFILLASIVPHRQLLVLLNGIFLGIVVAVSIVYAPLIYLTFSKIKIDRVSQLLVGIGMLWLSIAGQKFWWIIAHSFTIKSPWLTDIIYSGFSYIATIGGGLFVTAPGYPPENALEHVQLWGANRRLLLTLGTLGGLLASMLSLVSDHFF